MPNQEDKFMCKERSYKFIKLVIFSLFVMIPLTSLLADHRVRVRFNQITRTTGGEGNYAGDVPRFTTRDGKKITFASDLNLAGIQNTNREIFLWREGRGFTQITQSQGGDDGSNIAPSMNADGTRIVFMSDRDLTPGNPGNEDGNHEIFLWTEGVGLTQITDSIGGGHTTGFANGWPVINADGTRIAFHSDVDLTPGEPGNPNGYLELYLWTEGVGLTQLTSTAPNTTTFAISFSADGRRLAFYSNADLTPGNPGNPDGNHEIFLWTEGQGFTQITNTSGCTNNRPAITSDGRRIAFESTCDLMGNGNSIRAIFLWSEGVGFRQITVSQLDGEDAAVSISGDGRRLAFWSNRDLTPRRPGNRDGSYQLFLWIEGRGLTQITNTRGDDFPNRLPLISLDGTKIVFESDRDLLRNGSRNREIFRAVIRIDR